jgi:hypothetical protein
VAAVTGGTGEERRAAARPAEVCRGLLASLEVSERRRRRRARDTTADAIGLAIKRALLDAAVRDDPDPDAFEAWLLEQCLAPGAGGPVGARRAMALEVLTEWRLLHAAPAFRAWLDGGAPADDAAG